VPSYRAPGVYIEEVSTGSRPIEAFGTSVAAFLGTAPNKEINQHVPTACNNWEEFFKIYCEGQKQTTDLAQAVGSFFWNGGTRCYIVNLGDDELYGSGSEPKGIDTLKAIDEISIVVAPGITKPLAHQAMHQHCEVATDRVSILDVPAVTDLNALVNVDDGSDEPASAGKAPGPAGPRAVGPPRSKRGYSAAYLPNFYGVNFLDPKGPWVLTPISGAIAGIYARTDAARGVHKAPANETIVGVQKLERRLTQQDQELLNQAGLNVVRWFTGRGAVLWGARTRADDPAWRYVNVRRFYCMVEKAIARGTQWVVFEPNDQRLWMAVKRDIEAFLVRQWRDGALMGRTPAEAFYVRCDEALNTSEVVEAGQLIVEIGLAVVRPAEFVVFRIGQYAGGTSKTQEVA
jgi:phage tail sheath protein FI